MAHDPHDHEHPDPGHGQHARPAAAPHGQDDDHDHGHNGHHHDEDDHAEHGHDHDHEHHDHDGHDHDGHDHEHGGWLAGLRHAVLPHSHDHASTVDSELESSREGMRTLWLSLAALGLTAALQAAVVAWSGSVALLGDTLHNVADALTALPLALAFAIGRRPANRRYTYGYGRAEDIAGIVIVVVITVSAIAAGWAAVDRLRHPADVHHLLAVAVAAVIGFVGNEAVARLRIRVGARIGSAALVADGLHARTDGFTSLAVLLGAGGVAIGWRWADPVVGLAITVAILAVLGQAAREIYHRLMDAVDPSIVDAVESTLRATPGVLAVGAVKLRWIGHLLRAECDIMVDDRLTVVAAHAITVDAEHRLLHEVPRLRAALVHADPAPGTDPGGHARGGTDYHADLAHHRGAEEQSPAHLDHEAADHR